MYAYFRNNVSIQLTCHQMHALGYIYIKQTQGTPTSLFLNDLLTWASKSSGFALLGVIFLSVFAFYLYFCILKGNFKFGLRFMIMEIHPMKMGGTYVSSFLVNVSLILMTTPALIQFISSAFADYIVLTDVDAIFGQQIKNMRFFSYFFSNNVFEITMLGVGLVTFIWVFCVPSRDVSHAKEVRRRIQRWSEAPSSGVQAKATDAAAKAAQKVNARDSGKAAAVAAADEDLGVAIELTGVSVAANASVTDGNGAGAAVFFDPKLDNLYGDGNGGDGSTMHDNPFGAPNKKRQNADRNALFMT
jgi:hypothetical protein